MSTITYTITMRDFSGNAPIWMRGPSAIITEGSGHTHQRSMEIGGRYDVYDLYTFIAETQDAAALEAALNADESVIEYAEAE